MPVSHEHRFIFIHVPKCAGTSITRALAAAGAEMDYDGTQPQRDLPASEPTLPQHLAARKLRAHVGEQVWRSYFKFAIVRNPWDRMVSFYHFHKERVKSPEFRQRRPRIADIFARTNSFDEWVHAGIYAPRYSFHLCDQGGRQLVDFIGRFENLSADFQLICASIGVEARLPHLRRTEHGDYQTYYTPASRELVADYFRGDIRQFGYTFS